MLILKSLLICPSNWLSNTLGYSYCVNMSIKFPELRNTFGDYLQKHVSPIKQVERHVLLLVHRGNTAYIVWHLNLLNVHRILCAIHVVFCDINQVRLTCQITDITEYQLERMRWIIWYCLSSLQGQQCHHLLIQWDAHLIINLGVTSNV